MTPFRDTMRLIHRIKTDLHTFQEVHILVLLQTLRSQIQQLRLAGNYVIPYRIDLSATQTRVDKMRHTLFFRIITHRIYLILH